MRLRIADIREKAKTRPETYFQDVLAQGRINGEFLEIAPMDYRMLLAKYAPQITAVSSSVTCCGMPSVITQFGNATKAAGRIMSASLTGNKVKATEEVIEQRRAICQGCEFMKNDRCSKCGCRYKLKITLATEKCPINRW